MEGSSYQVSTDQRSPALNKKESLLGRKNGVYDSCHLVALLWAGLGAASVGVKVGVFQSLDMVTPLGSFCLEPSDSNYQTIFLFFLVSLPSVES